MNLFGWMRPQVTACDCCGVPVRLIEVRHKIDATHVVKIPVLKDWPTNEAHSCFPNARDVPQERKAVL